MAKKKVKVKKAAARKVKRPAVKAKSRMKAKTTKKVVSKKSATKSKPRATAAPSRPKWIAEGYNVIAPALVVRDVQAAIDFYQSAFGFKVRNVMKGPDNSIMHAELTHRDSTFMMGPENQERGSFAPSGPSPVTMYVYVADVDAVTDLARLHGGNVVQPPADMFWGDRVAAIVDPQGHSWMLATHIKDIAYEDMKMPSPDETVN